MLKLVLADSQLFEDPELIHFTLLLATDSSLAIERELKTIVHTRKNNLFIFEPDTEIPDELEDFKKYISMTLKGDPPHGWDHKKQSLMDFLKNEVGNKIVMSPKGDKKDPINVFSRAEDYIVVIGGFKGGDFVSPVYDWADTAISISDRLLKTWTVAAEVMVAYRYCSLE
ncbi:MAG: hypothetical protein R6U61_08075 [Thermoplasmata archaeon]